MGSRLIDIASPLVGKNHTDDLAAAARAIDAAPELIRLIHSLVPPASQTTTTGSIPAQDHPPAPNPVRWPLVLLVIIVSALVVAGSGGIVLELRDLRATVAASELRALSRAHKMETRVARDEGAAAEARRQDDQRTKETKARVDQLAKETADHSQQIALLTEHMIGRLEAIGKRTGADRLDEWTEVPSGLQLLVVQRRVSEAAAGG